jgi:hypothetical protein
MLVNAHEPIILSYESIEFIKELRGARKTWSTIGLVEPLWPHLDLEHLHSHQGDASIHITRICWGLLCVKLSNYGPQFLYMWWTFKTTIMTFCPWQNFILISNVLQVTLYKHASFVWDILAIKPYL